MPFRLAFLLFLAASCGKKYRCFNETIPPVAIGYSLSEADTLAVYRYQTGTNFSQLIDSVYLTSSNSFLDARGDTISFLPRNDELRIDGDFDARLRNPYDGRSISISELTVDEQYGRSNSLFGWHSSCTSPLMSFRVNGTLIQRSDTFLRAAYLRR